MSKLITLTPECLEQCKQEFLDTLASVKLSDGKINYTKTFGAIDRKAVVYFTEMAWLKMQTLVRECDKEVAWHGIAMRGEDKSKDEYFITDILVYPQEVTGATVNTDQEKYQTWLFQHDDEVFNNIRMQGHSHVNMGTTPSAVDLSLYERLLDQLDTDMFYIFMIWNKRQEKTVKIYDMKKNILFETADVSVEVLNGAYNIEQFLSESKEMVKTKPTTYGNGYSYGNGYGGYGGANKGGYGGYSTPSAYSKKEEGTQPGKPQAPAESNKKNKKRRGKRNKNRQNDKGGKQISLAQYYGYEDVDEYDADCGEYDYYEKYYGRGY